MSNPQASYDALITELKETALLSTISSVLHWDERTQMPAKGAGHRANQTALMARLIHQRQTSPKIGDWLSELERSELVTDPISVPAVNVREARRSYDRAVKLPPALVEELARTAVLAQQAWAEARAKSTFAIFRPWLEKIVALVKQAAACLGNPSRPYDALLDEFEPGDTADDLKDVFESLRAPLVDLVGRIMSSGRKAPVEILERHYPAAAQEKLARQAAELIGFDFTAGRLDVSLHPFSTDLGPGDRRITTRYDEKYFGDAFFGVMHEVGHALYNFGIDSNHFGTPMGHYVSLGIHESQSRMWENLVGRSRAFWEFVFPQVQSAFPEATADVSPDQWLWAVNDVRPSLIRTESDEATYNLHVLLRFELEQALISGDLATADVPGAWNERMKKYLGITPPDDARGCLQDIHWSGGAIGYFPTYTLGNLYAAQFFEQARVDLGDLDGQFARGEFGQLLRWLTEKIHRQGMRYRARDLVQHVTGRPLSAEPLLKHLNGKAAELYGV
jgi:carboxypeptidase Taq